MNRQLRPETVISVCPHDCPSACSLEVERLDADTIGRVRGAKAQGYTAGVICAKVARYAERIHHPERLTEPLRRTGPKGSGQFAPIGWDEALDEIAEKFLDAERQYGPEAVWPFHYAGTMGLVQRDGIKRLRHAKRYSAMYETYCVNLSYPGYIAGTGRLAGVDPREMARSDFVVIWGTNPVSTQVNVMTHALKARKERGAKIAVIDVYRTGTMQQADIALCLKPGTDGALACAVMHVLFRDGFADRDYLEKYTDCPAEFERHLKDKTPQWASAITGLDVEEIEAFAKLIGETPRTFFRLGFGFSRSRNGAVNMHAALSIPAVTGAWLHEGGGALHSNSGMYKWNKTVIEGQDVMDTNVRQLDQGRIGPVLLGDGDDLQGGPPVTAMLMQNTNPAVVAPDQRKVRAGLSRGDLFLCVHEQFMTETAKYADIVLPATMFMEHDDVYQGGGHTHIMFGPKIVEPPDGCRSNHEVNCAIAARVGAEHPGFQMTERELIDRTLRDSGRGTLDEMEQTGWIDVAPDFETAHYVNGFAWPDGRFRFRPVWAEVPFMTGTLMGPVADMPELPDHWAVIETADEEHPFRLATSPARSFLNSTFTETPTSKEREARPHIMIHPDDAASLKIGDGARVRVGNKRGEVVLHARYFDGMKRGVLIAEGIWPPDAHEGGEGINTLTGADTPAPFGGVAYHDNKVWIRSF